MEGNLWLEFFAIIILVLANGFFVLAEFSVIASRRARLKERVEKKHFGAARAFRLHDNPEMFLATIQLGISLVGALLGVFSGDRIVDKIAPYFQHVPIPFIAEHANDVSLTIVVIVLTILTVLFGELVPKYIALSNPERFAGITGGPISGFIKVSSYFARALSAIARVILSLFGIKRDPSHQHISEEEINQMIHEGAEKGIFDKTEQQLIRAAFSFSDSSVRRAMRPRTDVIAISKNATPEELMRVISNEGYSRYPVYDGSIDRIVGVINVKDVLNQRQASQSPDIASLIRQPLFVPDSLPLATLLLQFQRGKNHMAIVLDEFGGTAGIITLEDVLEELVGEIQDEHDTEAPPIVKQSETVAVADGSVWPGEVNRIFGTNLPEDTADTLAGLFMDEAGRLPEKHETVQVGNVVMTILLKDRNRILRIKLEKVAPTNTSQ